MPVTDPIGDLLTRMRNAQSARRNECSAPWSRLKQQLAELLKAEGMIANVIIEGEGIEKEITVVFAQDKPPLSLKRVSTPGRRVYSSADELRPVLNGFGIAVITTNNGLLTDREARKRKVGGEILCTVS